MASEPDKGGRETPLAANERGLCSLTPKGAAAPLKYAGSRQERDRLSRYEYWSRSQLRIYSDGMRDRGAIFGQTMGNTATRRGRV